MRIHKLGSRFLRVVTRDRRIHYFSTSGLCSLRVFWIFRNFSNIDDRVLNARQLRLIRRVCSTTEIPRGSVDFERLIGTVELSTTFTQASTPAVASPVPGQSSEPATADVQLLRIPSMVVSAAAVAACLLVAVAIFAKASVRHQITAATSRSLKSMAAMLPRAPRESITPPAAESGAPDPALVKVALSDRDQNLSNAPFDSSLFGTADPAELRPATLRVASLNELPAIPITSLQPEGAAAPEARRVLPASDARPVHQHKRAALVPPANMAEVLPPSGPPRSHPVPADFSEVSKDAKVILRAIVSADGKVSRVHVVEGNPQLAREAARAVSSWKYSPRAGSGDAESRILFQFAPDVTIVSFLNSDAPKIGR